MELQLKRHTYHPHCTMGWLYVGTKRFATIERPWMDNKPYKSCIPEGTYALRPYSSDKFPVGWSIDNVPGRSDILIHVGNYASDLTGCIAVGMMPSRETLMVLQSRIAIEQMRDLLQDETDLSITISFERGATP